MRKREPYDKQNNLSGWYKTRLYLNGLATPHVFSLNNGYVYDDRAWRVAFYFKVKPFLWNSVIVVCVISCIIVVFGATNYILSVASYSKISLAIDKLYFGELY